MKKTVLFISLVMVMMSLFGACTVPVSNTTEPSATQSADSQPVTPADTETVSAALSTPIASKTAPQVSTPSDSQPKNDMAVQTKEYLMHGQDDKPEAGKLHWTQEFLDQVDIEAVYAQYLTDGGAADDVLSFAAYLTENAPVPDNWKELFEANLLIEYDVVPSRYEDLGDGYYQVYVIIDGNEVPYVGLNARTGYFHG
jgi:hypothetical protein